MTEAEKVKALREAVEEIRKLTFDLCFDHHRLTGPCFKNEKKDWARIQSIAAAVLRKTE